MDNRSTWRGLHEPSASHPVDNRSTWRGFYKPGKYVSYGWRPAAEIMYRMPKCEVGRTAVLERKFGMGRVIAIANQKGGVGKTTTAINLSACLAEAGQRVLTVDFDPQGNATSGLGLEKGNIDNTVYELLMGECQVGDCIMPSVQERLDVMPSDVDLSGAEIELLDMKDKENILKENLNLVKDNYDFIIIDCPPSLSLLTINALTAANTALIPIQCEYYALEGLNQVLKTVNLVQKKLNPELEVEGVVFTMYDSRTNLSLEVVENVKEHLNENIYKTIIPRNVRLAEAPSYGMPINMYDSRSTGAENYRLLAAEVISRGEEV